jgi:hypothetical protein
MTSNSCGVTALGAEAVYTYSPSSTSLVLLDLETTAAVDLEIIVLEDTGLCMASDCVLAAVSGDLTGEMLVFEAVLGTDYFVVIDGKANSDEGTFVLDVLCSSAVGYEHCGNSVDDDGDGDIDCDDSDCDFVSVCIQ